MCLSRGFGRVCEGMGYLVERKDMDWAGDKGAYVANGWNMGTWYWKTAAERTSVMA